MIDADIALVHARTLVTCLADSGVPDPDLLGTARAGLVLLGLDRIKTETVRRFRADIDALPEHHGPPDPRSTARYLGYAAPRLVYATVMWDDLAALGLDPEAVFATLWAALDQIECDHMLGAMA